MAEMLYTCEITIYNQQIKIKVPDGLNCLFELLLHLSNLACETQCKKSSTTKEWYHHRSDIELKKGGPSPFSSNKTETKPLNIPKYVPYCWISIDNNQYCLNYAINKVLNNPDTPDHGC